MKILQTRHGSPQTNLGRCLRAYRTMSGVTLRDLAPKIGTSPATLMRIEQGYAMDGKTLMTLMNWLLRADETGE